MPRTRVMDGDHLGQGEYGLHPDRKFGIIHRSSDSSKMLADILIKRWSQVHEKQI
jgi:hypothetical protein